MRRKKVNFRWFYKFLTMEAMEQQCGATMELLTKTKAKIGDPLESIYSGDGVRQNRLVLMTPTIYEGDLHVI